jgi:hypothetical protein
MFPRNERQGSERGFFQLFVGRMRRDSAGDDFSTSAQSAVLKMDPTLNALRRLSSTTMTGQRGILPKSSGERDESNERTWNRVSIRHACLLKERANSPSFKIGRSLIAEKNRKIHVRDEGKSITFERLLCRDQRQIHRKPFAEEPDPC